MAICPNCQKELKYIRIFSNMRNVFKNYCRLQCFRVFTCEHCKEDVRPTLLSQLALGIGLVVVVYLGLAVFPGQLTHRSLEYIIPLFFVVWIFHFIWWKFIAKFTK